MSRWLRLYLDDIFIMELGIDGNHFSIHFRAKKVVPDIRIELICKVERSGMERQVHHVPVHIENEHAVLKEVGLKRHRVALVGGKGFEAYDVEEPLRDVRESLRKLVPLGPHCRVRKELVEPRIVWIVDTAFTLLIRKVRCHAVLGLVMHRMSSYLYLDERPIAGEDGRVEALIAVRLWEGDVVLDAAGERAPRAVHHSERPVTILNACHMYPDRGNVVYLSKLLVAFCHLGVHAVDALKPRVGLGIPYARLDQVLQERLAELLERFIALSSLFFKLLLELGMLFRIDVLKCEVFELTGDRPQTETIRERDVYLHSFAGDAEVP